MSKWFPAVLLAHLAPAASSTCTLVAGGAGFGSGTHQLGYPAALELDPSGQLLVAERYNRRVTRWRRGAANGSIVARWDKEAAEQGSTVAVHGSPPCAPPCEAVPDGFVGGGLDIAVRGHTLWVVRYLQSNFLRYDLRRDGNVELSLEGSDVFRAGSSDDFKAFAAGDGWYAMGYVPDRTKRRYTSGTTVRKYSGENKSEVVVVAPYGRGMHQLTFIMDLAVHVSGDIYTLESLPARVMKWAPGSNKSELVVWCTLGTTLVNFKEAMALAVDKDRNIYVADFDLDRVAVWPPGAREGVVIAGGNGRGSALNQLNGPRALLLDGKGQLFIVDEGNHRVLMCQVPAKIVTGRKGHVAPMVAVIVLFGAISVLSPLVCIFGGLAGCRKLAARLASPKDWFSLDWWCRGSSRSGKSRGCNLKSLLFRALNAFARIGMWFILATCFLWFGFGVYDCLWGWSDDQWVQLDDGEVLQRDVFSTGELCRGIGVPHRYAHPLWSWLLFTIHWAAAVATISPSIWLVSVANNLHIRGTAILALTNWACHAMTFLQDAKVCFGSRFTSANLEVEEMIDSFVQFAAGFLICFGWLLTIFRLHALERASWQRLTVVPLKSLLLVPAFLVLHSAYVVLQYFHLLHPRPDLKIEGVLDSIWIPSVPLFFLGFVTFHGLVVARRLVRRAMHCAPPEQAERARRTAANLEKQPPIIFLAMATTTFSVWIKGMRKEQVAPMFYPPVELRDEGPAVMIVERFVMLLDAVTTCASALLLSGVMHGAVEGSSERAEAKRRRRRRWRKCTREFNNKGQEQPLQRQWNDSVAALANRGISVQCLLSFWRKLPELMPHFDPERSTTNDVVRGAIIPLSAPSKGAACGVLMPEAARPDMMVTHNWGNLFAHLVAAVLADAFGEGSYENVARLLKQDLELLEQWVEHFKVGSRCYWICAFGVNQHLAICGCSDNRRDTVTGLLYPLCDCDSPKIVNDSEPQLPDGRSILCELNKFDDMMKCLSAGNVAFGQTIAVDLDFDIFTRAWCIAEIATAHQTGMEQHVMVFNQKSVAQHSEALSQLRIQDMEATRPEDKEHIMRSIENVEAFNTFVRRLLLEDLFPKWASLDAEQHMEYVGNLIRWCRTFGWETRTENQEAAPEGTEAAPEAQVARSHKVSV